MDIITVWVMTYVITATHTEYPIITVHTPTHFVTQQDCTGHGNRLRRLIRDSSYTSKINYTCDKLDIIVDKIKR